VPSAQAQADVEALVTLHGVLAKGLKQASAAVSAKQREIDETEERKQELGETVVPADLSVALAAAERLGDVLARSGELTRTLQKAQREESASYDSLGPWRRAEAELRQMVVPNVDQVARHVAKVQVCEADLRSVTQGLEDKNDAKGLQVTKIEAFIRSNKTVSAEQVLAAREARDALWGDIAQDPAQVLPQASKFRDLVEGADSLADDRFDNAAADGTLSGYQEQLKVIETEIKQGEKRKAALEEENAALGQEWLSITSASGLLEMEASALPTWLAARTAALAASQLVAQAGEALAGWDEGCELAASALRGALGEEAQASDALPLLVEKAKRVVKAAETASAQADELMIQQRQNGKDLKDLQVAEEEAQQAQASWSKKWSEALEKAGLSQEFDASAAAARLSVFKTIGAALKEISRLRSETIDRRTKQEVEFEEAVVKLTTRLGRDMAGKRAAEVIAELHLQAEASARNHEEKTRLQQRKAVLQARVDEARREALRGRGLVQPMMLRCGVETAEELAGKVAASDKRRRLEARKLEVETALAAAGDGSSVKELQVACAGVDAESLAKELGDLETKDQQMVDSISERAVRREQATKALEAISGSDAAARAATDRKHAVGVMADAIEGFIFAKASERLLRRAVERYRESQQGPMLANASKYFKMLTLESFEGLIVDFDHDPPKLEGKRKDRQVPVSGMSDGTRDQLFLALRLAGLEMQLASGHGMPFIADDLFVNFDDMRSEAGLRCLGELAQKTQVIFLTHHEHLVEPAKRVFGAELNVLRL
jgi:uncharacterized protein YhaN